MTARWAVFSPLSREVRVIHPAFPAPSGGWPGERVVPLDAGWEMCLTAPDDATGPAALPELAVWLPAAVPGIAAQALADTASAWPDVAASLHERDVWYRLGFQGAGDTTLRFAGLAGLSEVWLNFTRLAASDSMFVAFECPAALAGENLLHIRFRALSRGLDRPRGPAGRRPRWRTRLVRDGRLRTCRQTLLGHMPGWCPPTPAVGPYRRIEQLVAPGPVRACRLAATLSGADGVLAIRLDLTRPAGPVRLSACGLATLLAPDGPDRQVGELAVPNVAPWWPHTHGTPVLHEVRAQIGDTELCLGRVGFRTVSVDHGADGRGFRLMINGVPVFCRGACWTSAGLAATRADYAPWLRLACQAGMNMIRVGGTMTYEADAFHALCDELGLLVWQDFMFANFDYPADDPDFMAAVEVEIRQLLARLGASPSLAVLCGGSEVAQQAAMLGLSHAERRSALFDDLLPALAATLCPEVPYVAGSPSGGGQPFASDAGAAHYYGVGAYLRPLDDARRANVRFASECLALANLPAAETLAGAVAVIDAAPPRDNGVAWDFADVRDHYLRELYGVAPDLLRRQDPERYAALSRAVSADLMETALAEWRRPGSSCGGALVWQLGDLAPGAGWGVIDAAGRPKSAWHGMQRVLAPIQVLLSDEGMNGLGVHLVNDTAAAVPAVLTLRALRHGAMSIAQGSRTLTLGPRCGVSISSFELLERFFDFTRAYHFGPGEHDVSVATLCCATTGGVLSEAFHFPCGRALPACEPGLAATIAPGDDGAWTLGVSTDRFAQAVQVEAPGFRADPDWFHLPPGPARRVVLHPEPRMPPGSAPHGVLRALNFPGTRSFGSAP